MFGLSRRRWALHNPLKSWTLSGLSLRECQLLVAAMSDADMKVSWAYRRGWEDWKPLSGPECHSLFLYKDKESSELPPAPEIHRNDDDHDITQVRSSMTAPKFKDPVYRKHTRYQARISAEILVGTHCYTTHTVDL